jgi:hypothetical protein
MVVDFVGEFLDVLGRVLGFYFDVQARVAAHDQMCFDVVDICEHFQQADAIDDAAGSGDSHDQSLHDVVLPCSVHCRKVTATPSGSRS